MAYSVTRDNEEPSGPAEVKVPDPSPIVQQGTPVVKNNVQVQGGSSGSSGGGIGSFLGPVGGIIGDVLGGLFAQGGLVQTFAAGGQVNNPIHNAMALGYLVGALHQKDFNGTPDTLPKAAGTIKTVLDSKYAQNNPGMQHQFAGGGEANIASPDAELAQKALADALGLTPGTSPANGAADNSGTPQLPPVQQDPNNIQNVMGPSAPNMGAPTMGQPPSGPANQPAPQEPIPAGMTGPDSNQQQDLSLPDYQRQQQMFQQMPQNGQSPPMMPMAPQQARGYAQGGPPMPLAPPPQGMMQPPPSMGDPKAAAPPLPPGQPFQGDGSVKGPGGPTDDTIPAKLSNGEFVMSAAATQYFGVDKLTQMNEKGKQGFMQATGKPPPGEELNTPQGNPSGPPMNSPPGMPPMGGSPQPQMAKGGSVMRSKSSGYCGM